MSEIPSRPASGQRNAPDSSPRPVPGHHPRWLAHLLRPVNRRYGTYRGLIRLWLTRFLLAPGALVLTMELRHLRALRSALAGKPVQASLLGLWTPRSRPHIHDPHRLNAEYFHVCFDVITASVQGLAVYLRDAPARDRT